MELMVLLAVVRLGEDAYGVPISKELLILARREVALGSIYAALDRLGQKAFVTSSLGDPTPERGGRAKRYFRPTPTGLRALRMTRTARINLSSGIPLLEGRRTLATGKPIRPSEPFGSCSTRVQATTRLWRAISSRGFAKGRRAVGSGGKCSSPSFLVFWARSGGIGHMSGTRLLEL